MRWSATILILFGCEFSDAGSPLDEEDALTPVTTDEKGSDADPAGSGNESEGEGETDPIDDVRCTFDSVANPLALEALSAAGSFAFDAQNHTFVDDTRATPASGIYAGADDRTLAATIWYPTDGPAFLTAAEVSEDGPFPLVIYSHGMAGSRDEGRHLGEHLATHGFIVVAPTFPLATLMAPGGPTLIDLENQLGDVKFLIDQMLDHNAVEGDTFFERIDPEQIALVGLSMGGLMTSLLTYHPSFSDERVKLAVSLAGPSSFLTEVFYSHRLIPLLHLHGSFDAFAPYPDHALHTLEVAQPNVNLVSIGGGSHLGFAPGGGLGVLGDLLGGIVGPEGADPNHADSLACAAMDSGFGGDFDFTFDLGGKDVGIDLPPEGIEPPNCGLEYLSQPTIEPQLQIDIARRAVTSYLKAYFAGTASARERHCHYLNETLGGDPLVTVQ